MSNDNERVHHIPQSSRTGASPSDCLVSYSGNSLGPDFTYLQRSSWCILNPLLNKLWYYIVLLLALSLEKVSLMERGDLLYGKLPVFYTSLPRPAPGIDSWSCKTNRCHHTHINTHIFIGHSWTYFTLQLILKKLWITRNYWHHICKKIRIIFQQFISQRVSCNVVINFNVLWWFSEKFPDNHSKIRRNQYCPHEMVLVHISSSDLQFKCSYLVHIKWKKIIAIFIQTDLFLFC